MSRHLSDPPRTRGTARLLAFLRQDLADRPNRATIALQTRPQTRDDGKITHYMRIARDQRA